jgi:hypothetical protein
MAAVTWNDRLKSKPLVSDKIAFKRFGKLTEGTVIGFNKTMIIVKLPNEQLMEIKATEVTRIEK